MLWSATDAPVTPIDLVAASGWMIEANLIADFVKAQGDRISYGAYAKGGGSDNLVISCSDVGIYVNRAAQSRLLHNTVIDTAGIKVRFGESAAEVTGNQVNAPIVARDGATMDASGNDSSALLSMYLGLARLGASRCTAQNPPWANQTCGDGGATAASP